MMYFYEMRSLYEKRFDKNGFVVVLEATDDWQKYIDALNLDNEELDLLKTMKNFRKKEFLSARYGFQQLLDRPAKIIKDRYGKPWIKDDSNFISISHSVDRLAIIYHEKRCGIDIQLEQEKILNLAPKFITAEEISEIPEDEVMGCTHYYWGAKESLFKAYGEKKVDFKKHLNVPLMSLENPQVLEAQVKKENYEGTYNLHFEKLEEYYLAYAIEK